MHSYACVSVYPERYGPGALSEEGRFGCLFNFSSGGRAVGADLNENTDEPPATSSQSLDEPQMCVFVNFLQV